MTRHFFTSLFERAFKMMKTDVYFIRIALLVAKLFKILIYANQITCDVTLWTQNDVKSQKNWNISEDYFFTELKLCAVVTLTTKCHDVSTVTFPWQHNGLQAFSIQKIKSVFSPSRSVICSCCLFNGCKLIWTLHGTRTGKSVRFWSNK